MQKIYCCFISTPSHYPQISSMLCRRQTRQPLADWELFMMASAIWGVSLKFRDSDKHKWQGWNYWPNPKAAEVIMPVSKCHTAHLEVMLYFHPRNFINLKKCFSSLMQLTNFSIILMQTICSPDLKPEFKDSSCSFSFSNILYVCKPEIMERLHKHRSQRQDKYYKSADTLQGKHLKS